MGKGRNKRFKSRFTRGHPRYEHSDTVSVDYEVNEIHQRLSSDVFQDVVEYRDLTDNTPCGPLVIRDSEGRVLGGRILRPRIVKPAITEEYLPSVDEDHYPSENGYRLLHQELTRKLWNQGFRGHMEYMKNCDGELFWNMGEEKRWGLGWKCGLVCHKCKYKSEIVNLYKEIVEPGKRGRRSAEPNVGLQVGLTQTPLGNTGFRKICTAIGIPPPSQPAMQKATNKVSSKLVELNQDDMLKHIKHVQEICKLKDKKVTGISVEVDSCYNIPLWAGGDRTCHQPATQCITTFAENVTNSKKIIGVYVGNKHCAVAQTLRAKNIHVTCPNHSGHCSSNMPEDAIVGNEHRNTKIAYQNIINSTGAIISAVTTDGDSKSANAIEDINVEKGIPPPEKLRDPSHLSRLQGKHIQKQRFSQGMFPATTKAVKEKILKKFSTNVRLRCNAEIKCAVKKFAGDFEKMASHLDKVTETMLACYNNDCGSKCRQYSMVCGKHAPWPHSYLTHGKRLCMTDHDLQLLKQCILFRTSYENVQKIRLNTSTQKCEAVNRAYRKSLPKNVVNKRNAAGRAHSVIHELNNGPGDSVYAKLQKLGIEVEKGSHVARSLKKQQDRFVYDQKRQKTGKYAARRKYHRVRRQQLYDDRQKDAASAETYAKGLMDPMHMQSAIQQIGEHHTYSKNMTRLRKTIAGDHSY